MDRETRRLLHTKVSKTKTMNHIPSVSEIEEGQEVRVIVNNKLRVYTKEKGLLFYIEFTPV